MSNLEPNTYTFKHLWETTPLLSSRASTSPVYRFNLLG